MSVTKVQLEALCSECVCNSTFKVGDFRSFPMGMGTHLVLDLQDDVQCLGNKRFLAVWVERDRSYGGSAVEAGFGPIPFDNSAESFRWALEYGLQQLATGKVSPDDNDEETKEEN